VLENRRRSARGARAFMPSIFSRVRRSAGFLPSSRAEECPAAEVRLEAPRPPTSGSACVRRERAAAVYITWYAQRRPRWCARSRRGFVVRGMAGGMKFVASRNAGEWRRSPAETEVCPPQQARHASFWRKVNAHGDSEVGRFRRGARRVPPARPPELPEAPPVPRVCVRRQVEAGRRVKRGSVAASRPRPRPPAAAAIGRPRSAGMSCPVSIQPFHARRRRSNAACAGMKEVGGRGVCTGRATNGAGGRRREDSMVARGAV